MTTQITVVLNPPLPTDAPDAFDTKAFDTLSKINTWAAEANELADDVNAKQVAATEAATTATQKAETIALDAIATAADRVKTGQDRAATEGDREQTRLDRIATEQNAQATAAGRVQTGEDRQAVMQALESIEGGPVASVNTKTGPNVVLEATDVGAIAATSGTATGLKHTVVALGSISGATAINLATAGEFIATVAGNTALSFTNPPAAGQTQVVMMKLTNAGAFSIDWPAGTKFDNSKKEPLTAAGVDQLGLKFDPVTGTCTVYVLGLNVGVPV